MTSNSSKNVGDYIMYTIFMTV